MLLHPFSKGRPAAIRGALTLCLDAAGPAGGVIRFTPCKIHRLSLYRRLDWTPRRSQKNFADHETPCPPEIASDKNLRGVSPASILGAPGTQKPKGPERVEHLR
jgi:hypothetical protein